MNIELEITLKCNATCLNCNKFCHMEDLGIVYGDEMDLTLQDIDGFIQQVKNIGNVKDIRIMGGEPTLHPLYEDICLKIKQGLLDTRIIHDAYVVTNGILKRPSCLKSRIQMPMETKNRLHTCALVSPTDRGVPLRDKECMTPKVFGVSYNKLGWYPCGPGGAIARLFNLTNIKKDTVTSVDDWNNVLMDVCSKCQNKSTDILFQVDQGRPITESYQKAIDNYVSIHAPS